MTSNAMTSPTPDVRVPPTPRRWLAAVVMIGAVLMDMIDVTIVNVALPSIRSSLTASSTQVEWVVSAYLLAFATILIVAGSVGDRMGRKRLFLVGTAVFGLASLAAGLAQNPAELIAARAVQGAAAAVMVPQLLATFREMLDDAERGKAFAVYGGVLGFASAVGLVLGGALLDLDLFGWGWRTIFLVNVPIAVVALLGTARYVPETRSASAGRPDYSGAILLASSIGMLTYALLEGRSQGWPSSIFALIAAAALGLGCLAWRLGADRRRGARNVSPLFPIEMFRTPAVSAGLLVQLAFAVALQGFFLVFALWLQSGEGFSPLKAGLTTVAFSVGSFLLAPAAVPLAIRRGRAVLSCGATLLAVGSALTGLFASHVTHDGAPWLIVPGLVIAGAGLSLLVIPLVNVVLAAAPADSAGAVSGVFSTAQQLGGALGVAVIGSLFFGKAEHATLTDAFTAAVPVIAAVFGLAAVLALALPKTAVDTDAV